jgi:BolA family transcriptional regulator, general stress-responsive regulator
MNGAVPDRKTRLREKLEAEFEPLRLDIVDESHRHAGHQEQFDGQGETHLRVRITAQTFEGMSRVERHRAINAVAAAEFAAGLHALAIEAAAPSETGR